MPTFLKVAGAVLCGTWLLTGCSTAPRSTEARESAKKASPETGSLTASKPKLNIPVLSEEELQKRADAHAYYASAIIHDYNEEWEGAKTNYFKAAEADPGNEALVLEASQRLLQLKDPDKALEILTNATAQPSASAAIWAQLGRIQYMLRKKDLAIEANRTALRKSPRQLSAYRNLAQIYLHERQYEDGIKILDQATKQTEVDAAYLIEIGELYVAYTSTSSATTARTKALELFKRAASMKLTNLFQVQALADSLAFLGENDLATELYLKLLKEHVPFPGLREKLAGLYIRKQDKERAAEQLKAILRDQPANPQANYMMGSLAFEEKKMPEAAKYFRTTILHNADFEPAYYDLALAQLNQKEARQALETLQQARDKFKENFVQQFYSALCYNQLKDFTNVIRHMTSAEVIARATEQTNRLNQYFYFTLGAAYERSQRAAEAEKYLQQSIEIAPDFAEALNYLGYMWADKGTNLNQAREMIEKALKKEPKNAAFLDSLGWVFYKLGQNQEALKYLQESIANEQEPDATVYEHLGDVFSALQQPEKARDAWRKALSIEASDSLRKKLGASTSSQAVPK